MTDCCVNGESSNQNGHGLHARLSLVYFIFEEEISQEGSAGAGDFAGDGDGGETVYMVSETLKPW